MGVKLDKARHRLIAESTGVFNKAEMQCFDEILDQYEESPDKDYYIFEERDGDRLIGYIIFGEAPMTEFAWEIYWLAVEKVQQGRGVGKKLVKKVEDHLVSKLGRVVLRIETSSIKEYEATRRFYRKMGYIESGRIPNFQCEGNDLVTFYKEIRKDEKPSAP